jgi:anthranilate synthase component 2
MQHRILVYDNYDSFTYNLVHLIEKITHEKVDVYRNDMIPLEEVDRYDAIVLSPGPGIPEEAGELLPLIRRYASSKKILGVCLGHQAIAEAFGGKLINLSKVFHGLATPISVDPSKVGITERAGDALFINLPNELEVGRYHSWVVDEQSLPDQLEITARDEEGWIMAMRHREYNIAGVQFHPESVLTPNGEQMIRNWLNSL